MFPGIKGEKYIIAFVDSASRFCKIYFMETRNADEVTGCFKSFITWMKQQINHSNPTERYSISVMLSDQAAEYTGSDGSSL